MSDTEVATSTGWHSVIRQTAQISVSRKPNCNVDVGLMHDVAIPTMQALAKQSCGPPPLMTVVVCIVLNINSK